MFGWIRRIRELEKRLAELENKVKATPERTVAAPGEEVNINAIVDEWLNGGKQ